MLLTLRKPPQLFSVSLLCSELVGSTGILAPVIPTPAAPQVSVLEHNKTRRLWPAFWLFIFWLFFFGLPGKRPGKPQRLWWQLPLRAASGYLPAWFSEMAMLFMRATKPPAHKKWSDVVRWSGLGPWGGDDGWRHIVNLANGLWHLQAPSKHLQMEQWHFLLKSTSNLRKVVSNWLACSAVHRASPYNTVNSWFANKNRWKPAEFDQETPTKHIGPRCNSQFAKLKNVENHRTPKGHLSQGHSVESPHGRVASDVTQNGWQMNLTEFCIESCIECFSPYISNTPQRRWLGDGNTLGNVQGVGYEGVMRINLAGKFSSPFIIILSYDPHCRIRIPIDN